MLSDDISSDAAEAQAFSYRFEQVHIFVTGWGPEDDGKTYDGPGKLTKQVIEKGITEGRGGRGVIYVFASGN